MKKNVSVFITSLGITIILLAGCSPKIAEPEITPTPTQSPTYTITTTYTPHPTRSPRPTSTPIPSPTQIPGTFTSPYKIGDSISLLGIPTEYQNENSDGLEEISITLIDVKRGEEAKQLAKNNMDWLTYDEPISGQEYLAVKVHLNLLWYQDNNSVETLYPYWHLTLRYSESGDDTWSVDPILKFGEAYPPIEGEGWIFFLIKQESKPLLYFQPGLITTEQMGYRDWGVYFSLE